MADTIDKEQLSIVGSLFGVSPQQLQMAREQQAYTQGTQAGQNLLGGILGQTGMFAERAGSGLRNALGVQTPEEQIAALRQEAQQQFDTRTPEGLIQLAQYLNSKGDTTGAQQAVMLAQQRASTSAGIGKTLEETRLLGRKEIEVGVPGNPEMVQKVLVDKDGNVLRKLGDPYSRFSSKTNIVANLGEKNVLDIDKKDAENLVKIRDTASETIPLLEKQLKAVNQGMIQGSFNDARAVFANSLASLGIRDKETLKLLKNTSTFESSRIELASAVAKQLGVNPTDRDFQASLSRFASGSMQPEVSRDFINDMLEIQRNRLKNSVEGLNYFRSKKGSFEGYDRPLPSTTTSTTGTNLQDMSIEQLKALEKQLSTNPRAR